MTVSWKKGFNTEQLTQKLESARKDGTFGFPIWVFKEYEVHLYNLLDFLDNIPEVEARRIAKQSMHKANKKGVITSTALLSEANRLEKAYYDLPDRRYVLAASFSISRRQKLPRLVDNKTVIIFEPKLDTKFTKESVNLYNSAKSSLLTDLPKDYHAVRLHVYAKSIYDAADKALNSIDLIRGIWNWRFNRQHPLRITYSGKREPVNQIALGPVQTLHYPSGKLATDTWWYDPMYLGSIKPLLISQEEIEGMYKFTKNVRQLLIQSPYKQDIETAIIRYVRALDSRDWDTAFLKLWSVLELLTDTRNDSYNVTIRRTAFLFNEDYDYHFQILQYLREGRNSFVHLDKENSAIETYLYQTKSYVEQLLSFHLVNKFKFSSIQEAGSFLSLPHDVTTLTAKIKKLKNARSIFVDL